MFNVQVKLPLTHLDLAGLSDLSATVDLSGLDSLLAVGLPCLLSLLALPVCLARAAMLGLDCIAVRTQVQYSCWPCPSAWLGPPCMSWTENSA